MRRLEYNHYKLDEGEPAFRSCWICNSSHEHLRDVTFLHYCLWCDRSWIFGHFLDEFDTPDKLDKFLVEHLRDE